jgi:hypothetical protein
MANEIIVVKARQDEETGAWFVESSDLYGLNIEADTLDELIVKLPGAVLDLVEEGAIGGDAADRVLPIELIAHASTRVRIPAAA